MVWFSMFNRKVIFEEIMRVGIAQTCFYHERIPLKWGLLESCCLMSSKNDCGGLRFQAGSGL